MNKKNFKKNQCCVQGFEAVRVWSSSGPINFFLGGGSSSRGHNTLQCYLRHFENSSTNLNIMFSEAGTRAGPN